MRDRERGGGVYPQSGLGRTSTGLLQESVPMLLVSDVHLEVRFRALRSRKWNRVLVTWKSRILLPGGPHVHLFLTGEVALRHAPWLRDRTSRVHTLEWGLETVSTLHAQNPD